MFDRKKRDSLSLSTEEFRRMAVRRKGSGDCPAAYTASGGSCSCGQARNRISGSEPNSKLCAGAERDRSPAMRPQVPPKPSPTTGKLLLQATNNGINVQSSNRINGTPFSYFSPLQNAQGSPSPVRGGGISILNGLLSPARYSQGLPADLGSPSPGRRAVQNCTPLREGRQSSMLSQRNQNPLAGKFQTSSPVLGRLGSFSPGKNPQSLLGLNRFPNNKMGGQDSWEKKSLSVPDLIHYLDESRTHFEKPERTPLKPLSSVNRCAPAITIKAPAHQTLDCTENAAASQLPSSGSGHSPGKMNGVVLGKDCAGATVKGIIDQMEAAEMSKVSHQWTEATTENRSVHEESKVEQNSRLSAGEELDRSLAMRPQVPPKPNLNLSERDDQNCSLLKEGRHSPALLPPRNQSPLAGKFQTSSPVLGRLRSFSPGKNSKSCLGLNRFSNNKMGGQDSKEKKSLSVPDLIHYLDESRTHFEKPEHCPLRLQPSVDHCVPAIAIKAPANQTLDCNKNEAASQLPSSGLGHSPGKMNGVVLGKDCAGATVKGIIDQMEAAKMPMVSHQWTEATTENGSIHEESEVGQNSKLCAGEELVRSLAMRPQVPPKPSPTTIKLPPQPTNGLEVQSPIRIHGLPFSYISPRQNSQGFPSPVRGGGSSIPNELLSPARCSQEIPIVAKSPDVGSPSPGRRAVQNCSPLNEGRLSPAMLSQRNQNPLAGKLRTSSPVLGRLRSFSPGKNSKSWLCLNKFSNNKMGGQDSKEKKSLSVPDLIHYLDESSTNFEKPEPSPLNPLPSPNCWAPAITIKAPPNQTLDCPENKAASQLPSSGSGHLFKVEQEEEEEEEEEGKREPRKEETAEQKLYKIAEELLQTERTYVARLHLLDQVFCLHLTEEAGRGSFSPQLIKLIFSNISSIYSFHSQFLLPALEDCISRWCESPGLGNVLLQHAPYMRMYADYVRNFDQAMELLRTSTERYSAFRNLVQDIESQEVCGSLTLRHHMLEPVQRLPRYELLLRDYLRKLPSDNPDYERAQKSLQMISMAVTHSNSAIHKAENLKRLLEIYEMVSEEEVVNPTNEFLREGRLLKLAARNASAMERHLFLFNNFLLCCAPKFSLAGPRFTVRSRIGVDGMQVQQTTNEDHLYTFQVSGKEKTLELQASSEQDRDEWIKVIEEAIDVFQKKNETFKLASRELTVEEPTEELGRRAPRWIRDNKVTTCMKCQEPFNALTRRRHHCRACGCVVCWKCSGNKAALEYDGNKLNKVCKACFSILTGQRGERAEDKKSQTVESEAVPVSSDSIMSGFLQYGDNTNTWQLVWTVLTRSRPPVLHLYAVPQDVTPFTSIPLLDCSLEDFTHELRGQFCFRLSHNETDHTFCCEGPTLKQRWLAVLKGAVTGVTPPPLPPSPKNGINRCTW